MSRSLKEWRTEKPMSMRDLAGEAGISLATLYYIESGRRTPQPSTMTRLAAVLQVRVSDVTEFREAIKAHRRSRARKGGRS